jgi:hypothetical protein
MRVIRSKPSTSWLGTGLALKPFKRGHDDSLIDWDTHERKVKRLTRGTQPAIPIRFVTAIESSRCLLELGPDWDDAGAQPISKDTWRRATDFLRNTVLKAGNVGHIAPPDISACNDGSIDLFWNDAEFKLAVNIKPSDAAAASDFYGETASGFIVKGPVKSSTTDLGAVLRLLLDNK